MDKKRKICVVTGTRAEYGLLHFLMRDIVESPDLELQVVVTGMHLSPEFGLTWKQIEKDGFLIQRKVEILLSSDTVVGISKSMGLGIIGFTEAFEELAPDIIVVLGDRFEIFSATSAAMISCIPIAHLHGGEATEGLIDEPIRHSITKMSHLHFTSTEAYRRRVMQLGEQPVRVFNVGAIGIDNISRMQLLDKADFEKSIDFVLANRNLLITFHPVTLEDATAEEQFGVLLKALDELEETNFIFTKPNADTGGRIIIQMIDEYVARNTSNAIAFVSLGQLRYLSALQYIDGVVGNSSSGLIEAPSFHIGTINIGDRQRGRIKAGSVIDCGVSYEEIGISLNRLYSKEFQASLASIKSPYGEGSTSKKIVKILGEYPLTGIIKKQFYNLQVEG